MTATGGLPRRPGPSVRTRVTELQQQPEPATDAGGHAGPGTADGAGADAGAGDEARRHEDRLVTEEPLELRLGWPGRSPERAWLTMRTPGHDFELAVGWARHEGILGEAQAGGDGGDGGDGVLERVAYCTDRALTREQEFNVVTVTLAGPPAVLPGHGHLRPGLASSACGVCGKESLERALAAPQGARWEGPLPSPATVRRLPALLRARQPLFDRTGGSHAAGLFTADGDCLAVREDVGRHNAVDKVTGARLLAGDSAAAAVLVVSGRAGFELVQKAVAVGTGALVSVGAPTSLSVDLARRAGLALYGFTRPDRTVRYA
ncbi:formate dehydrogenase accessory sulfurtransferase FdhD [Nocardioides solisilvae]|uniref:formate dehydrogenase accessory sulfurtransferase FdhD n=1 Tax=Nocardioides solisilvae TaxID=1542435 RepID=UPI000D746D67|nr:formate dehydrogenase accessory sulfurtransferase FdhD [Nocardioides solisilvae]